MRFFKILLLSILFVRSLYAVSYNISAKELDASAQAEFPIVKSFLFSTFTFSNPRVRIDKQKDVILFDCDAQSDALVSEDNRPLIFKIYTQSSIKYDGKKIFLKDIVVQKLENEYLSVAMQKNLIYASQTLLNLYFASEPIYSIEDASYTMQLANDLVSDIIIDDGKIKIMMLDE